MNQKKTDAIGGIVLGAGESRRMGRPKQLLPYKDTLLLKWVVTQALESKLEEVALVLGHRAEDISASLNDLKDKYSEKLKIIINKDYKQGLSSSIKAGFHSLKDKFKHLMIILGDMPGISHAIIDELITGYLESGLPLGAISYKGKRSHPVIISQRFYPLIESLSGDTGARAIFYQNKDLICLIEPSSPYSNIDIDSMDEYKKAILSI